MTQPEQAARQRIDSQAAGVVEAKRESAPLIGAKLKDLINEFRSSPPCAESL